LEDWDSSCIHLSENWQYKGKRTQFLKEKNHFRVGIVHIFEMLLALINT
jgi:hypothetical protein